jgi:hypothetical protein
MLQTPSTCVSTRPVCSVPTPAGAPRQVDAGGVTPDVSERLVIPESPALD